MATKLAHKLELKGRKPNGCKTVFQIEIYNLELLNMLQLQFKD